MRIARTFALALLGAAALPSLSTAQSAAGSGRLGFEDSWFWGIKGGSTMFTAGEDGAAKVNAPTVGAEWLITRSRMALNFSIEQAFFDNRAGVYDPSAAGSVRPVAISDMRRYQASIFLYPATYGRFRPYAGLGLGLNVIQNAQPEGTFSSPESQEQVFADVAEQSSRSSFVLTGGVQAQFGRYALFAQAATMPTRNNFLINGASNTWMLEGGVRYNLVHAIERLK